MRGAVRVEEAPRERLLANARTTDARLAADPREKRGNHVVMPSVANQGWGACIRVGPSATDSSGPWCQGDGNVIRPVLATSTKLRLVAVVMGLVGSGCALLFGGAAADTSNLPELRRAPGPLIGVAIHVPEPILRGAEARHAHDVAAKLRDKTISSLRNAGFTIAHEARPDAAQATLTLDVDYCFVDVARIATQVLVTRAGAELAQFGIPPQEMRTAELPSATGVQVANQIVTIEALALADAGPSAPIVEAATTGRPRPENPQIVAILDLQDPDGALDAKARSQLTEYLTARAIQHHGWKSVPRAQIRDQLRQEKAASYDACVDDACQIELGKALAAEKVLVSKLLRLGQSCTLVATLYDLRTEATEAAATEKTVCRPEPLTTAIDAIINKLF